MVKGEIEYVRALALLQLNWVSASRHLNMVAACCGRATTQWTRGTAVARKEKYPVSPFLEFRPHWKADFFLPEVTGCAAFP